MDDDVRLLMKMPKEVIAERAAAAERVLSRLDDVVLYYVANVGKPARVVTRFSKGFFGILNAVHFELTEVEIATEMSEYDSRKGKYFREVKVVRVPRGNVAHFEIVDEREEEADPSSELEAQFDEIDKLTADM